MIFETKERNKTKTKKQKGITLIALIITIIVMLILVGVSVALNGGLFKTAKEAVEKTKLAVQEESSLKYDCEIAKATGKFTGSYEEYPLYKKYGLRIGDKVNYDESDGTPLAYETDASKGTYAFVSCDYTEGTCEFVEGTYTLTETGDEEIKAGDLEWRVLGINDEGQVELISTTPTECTLALYGKSGYLNAVTENGVRGTLDTFCNNIYGQGKGADSARSLKAEDINKLGNYIPVAGIKCTYKYFTVEEGASTAGVYGIDSANASADISNWRYTGFSTFYTPNWIIDSTNVGPKELENTSYEYTVANQVKITDPVDMATLITKGEDGTNYVHQWLDSRHEGGYQAFASFDLFRTVGGSVSSYGLYNCDGFNGPGNLVVRPVVSLKSDVQFADADGNGVYEIID